MNFAAAILAFIKGIPAAQKVFAQVVDLYFKQQEAAEINHYDKKKVKRDALIFAMSKQGITDEELKNIRRALYELAGS